MSYDRQEKSQDSFSQNSNDYDQQNYYKRPQHQKEVNDYNNYSKNEAYPQHNKKDYNNNNNAYDKNNDYPNYTNKNMQKPSNSVPPKRGGKIVVRGSRGGYHVPDDYVRQYSDGHISDEVYEHSEDSSEEIEEDYKNKSNNSYYNNNNQSYNNNSKTQPINTPSVPNKKKFHQMSHEEQIRYANRNNPNHHSYLPQNQKPSGSSNNYSSTSHNTKNIIQNPSYNTKPNTNYNNNNVNKSPKNINTGQPRQFYQVSTAPQQKTILGYPDDYYDEHSPSNDSTKKNEELDNRNTENYLQEGSNINNPQYGNNVKFEGGTSNRNEEDYSSNSNQDYENIKDSSE